MSAPKSILKSRPSSKAGPSRPGPSRLTGSKVTPNSTQGKKGGMTVAVKRSRPDDDDDEEEHDEDDDDAEREESDDDVYDDMDDQMDEDEDDTDDEIAKGKQNKSKRPQKKKRTTTAADFGTTLSKLLTEPTTTNHSKRDSTTKLTKLRTDDKGPTPILSLSSRLPPPTTSTETLERRAARQLKIEKMERLDKARIRDVVEGWAPVSGDVGSQEFEKGLRKIAQRGVIKLFNAILSASRQSESTRANLPLSAQVGVKTDLGPSSRSTGGTNGGRKGKYKDNVLGRGGMKEKELTKEDFLDLVRKGGK